MFDGVRINTATAALVIASALVATRPIYTVSGNPIGLTRLLRLAAKPRAQTTAGSTYLPSQSWVDTLPAGTRIAVERKDPYYDAFYFPLFGHDLQLRPVPITAASPAELLARLGELNATVLAARTKSAIDHWAQNDPSHFVPLGTAHTDPVGRRFGSAYRVIR